MSIKKSIFIRGFATLEQVTWEGFQSPPLKVSTALVDKAAVDLMLVIGLFDMKIRLETLSQV